MDLSVDWLAELPVTFTGQRTGKQWTWSDKRARKLCVESTTSKVCGIEIETWANQRGATELSITIVANPGAAAAGASAQGLGTQGQGTGEDARERAPARISSDMLSPAAGAAGDASSTRGTSRSVDEAFREMFSGMLGHESHEAGGEDGSPNGMGLGAQGTGAAQGASGERAVTGRGQDAGKLTGDHDGSRTPSWHMRPGAAVDNEWGGRTPDLRHGKPGGSAGGQQGGKGNLVGIWNGPIDIAATVAIAVNVVLVLLDADVNGLGGRFLGKVVGGLGGKRLRKELAREAAQVIDTRMREVKKQLAEQPAYQAMSKAEKNAVRAQARERLEREYHARARAYFAEQAERSEAIVHKNAGEAGEIAAHERELATTNARAYRELERAIADSGGIDVRAHIDASSLMQGKNARAGAETIGEASNYRDVFFAAYPELRGQVVVHHAIEQQILKRYPGLFTTKEIHSLGNLRGVPRSSNPDVHLSRIRRAWNEFYRSHATPTKQQVLDFAAELDARFGASFQPPR
jgi:hypothetical protein